MTEADSNTAALYLKRWTRCKRGVLCLETPHPLAHFRAERTFSMLLYTTPAAVVVVFSTFGLIQRQTLTQKTRPCCCAANSAGWRVHTRRLYREKIVDPRVDAAVVRSGAAHAGSAPAAYRCSTIYSMSRWLAQTRDSILQEHRYDQNSRRLSERQRRLSWRRCYCCVCLRWFAVRGGCGVISLSRSQQPDKTAVDAPVVFCHSSFQILTSSTTDSLSSLNPHVP